MGPSSDKRGKDGERDDHGQEARRWLRHVACKHFIELGSRARAHFARSHRWGDFASMCNVIEYDGFGHEYSQAVRQMSQQIGLRQGFQWTCADFVADRGKIAAADSQVAVRFRHSKWGVAFVCGVQTKVGNNAPLNAFSLWDEAPVDGKPQWMSRQCCVTMSAEFDFYALA